MALWYDGYVTLSAGASCGVCALQSINDLDLTALSDRGVNITGLRLVDVSNKTVRDFILERQNRRHKTLDNKSRHISVFHSLCLLFLHTHYMSSGSHNMK